MTVNKIIEWQYPGEDKQTILGADGYRLQKQKYQCPIFYRVRYQRLADNGEPIGNIFLVANSVRGPIESHQLVDFGNPVNGYVSVQEEYRYLRANGRSFFRLNINHDGQTTNIALNSESSRGIIVQGYVPSNNQLDNCGDCTLKILKNNQVVLQRVSGVCPEVEVYEDEICPPGSCECTHGSIVCCYNPNTGQVVKSFSR